LARASSGIGSAWLGLSRRWKKGGEGERGCLEGIRLGVRAGARPGGSSVAIGHGPDGEAPCRLLC